MRMFKYLTNSNTYRYVDVLPSLVDGYNATYHRSIKMHPRHVRQIYQSIICQHLYSTTKKEYRVYKYDIGTWVRISKQRQSFSKGYLPYWSEEIFIVQDCWRQHQPVYYLRNLNGEHISGSFYELEL